MTTVSKKAMAVLSRRIGVFIRQYGRRSQKRQDPNDRSYDREVEQSIRKLKPVDLDALIYGRGLGQYLGSNTQLTKISTLAEEFFEHVLQEEDPPFVSDDATVWDVSLCSTRELVERCSRHYGTPVSELELDQPLWKLIRMLDLQRAIAAERPAPVSR